MPRLKLFDALEARIVGVVSPRTRMGRMRVAPRKETAAELRELDFRGMERIAFHLTWYAEMTVGKELEAKTVARERVAEMLGREVFGELRTELYDLLEWVVSEGIGRDVEERVSRLVMLAGGHDSPKPDDRS